MKQLKESIVSKSPLTIEKLDILEELMKDFNKEDKIFLLKLSGLFANTGLNLKGIVEILDRVVSHTPYNESIELFLTKLSKRRVKPYRKLAEMFGISWSPYIANALILLKDI